MPDIEIPGGEGIRIHYETYGNFTPGPNQTQTPLLYVLGLGSDSASWDDVSSLLAAGRPIVVCDNRGCGRSSQPAGDYSIEAMARDLVAVLDHLELPKVHVLGHSMGGFLALEIAAKHPGRVSGLVLSSTALAFGERNAKLVTLWVEGMRKGIDPEWITADLAMWLYSPPCFEDPGFLERLVSDIMSAPYPQKLEGFAGQVAACIGFDGRALAPRISAPTLVIWGGQDILTPPDLSTELAERIPQARTLCIKNAAHLPQREKPSEFCSSVLNFLDFCEVAEGASYGRNQAEPN